MPKRAYKRGSIWIYIGLALIAAALCLFGYNMNHVIKARSNLNEIMNTLAPEMEQRIADAQISNVIPDYVLNPNIEMPEEKIGNYYYIGVVIIPKLDIQLPVMTDWSDSKLNVSPCRYVGSVYTHDIVVCAHNSNVHFGNLKDLEVGDRITFIDISGNIFEYEMTEMVILLPTDVEAMITGDWDLTLFTCTPGGPSRVTCRFSLVS